MLPKLTFDSSIDCPWMTVQARIIKIFGGKILNKLECRYNHRYISR